ncbi:MAG: cyclic nucleotide-binding domain-containing protein [Pseudomonadota bacterium]|nr:cyclic nucleotide-binding domain-containing protein [Pseudomonadota bacterium]
MKTSGKNILWSPGEIIYEADSEPNGIFIIMSGSVLIYSKDGLKLNTLKEKEVFGETSTILNLKRSVTAKAGPAGVTAIHVNTKNLTNSMRRNVALGAIIRKTQLRLIDSNNQSQELSNLMKEMLKKLEGSDKNLKGLAKLLQEASSKLAAIASSNLD